jgi:hypothetical protein
MTEQVKRGRGRPRKVNADNVVGKVEVNAITKNKANEKTKTKEKPDKQSANQKNKIAPKNAHLEYSKMTPNQKLEKVKELVENSTDGIIVMEDGKSYTKVSERVKRIRQVFGFDIKIVSNVLDFEINRVRVEAQIWIKQNNEWELVQTANAYEEKNTSVLNMTSYVEIAETSAVGRALGFLGLFGDEFASVDEVSSSINNSGSKKITNVVKTTNPKKYENKKMANEEQIKFLNNFISKNKDYTVSDILANYKVKKIEELRESDAKTIIDTINLQVDQVDNVL